MAKLHDRLRHFVLLFFNALYLGRIRIVAFNGGICKVSTAICWLVIWAYILAWVIVSLEYKPLACLLVFMTACVHDCVLYSMTGCHDRDC